MSRKINVLALCAMLLPGLAWPQPSAKIAGTKSSKSVESTSAAVQGLWTQPPDLTTRSLYYGPGGEDKQPGKTFTFIKEDTEGSNPKFEVQDENGVKWKVKLGDEAQPETAASRLVWAVGYHADDDYLLKEMRVPGLKLSRGSDLVEPGGVVRNARLKRHDGRDKLGQWSWRNAPFKGTREFDGLRVMMALIDNWDLKDENNAVLEKHGERIYEVSDLGASFGTTRALLATSKAKGNVQSFEEAAFITKITAKHVSFGTPSAPPVGYAFNAWDYARRSRMRWIGKDINRSHVEWIAGLLSQLTPDQIRDAFRAAGYSESEMNDFARTVQHRIIQLNALLKTR